MRTSKNDTKIKTVLGFMSGTSLDGVDAALLATDGRTYIKPIGFLTLPYDAHFRQKMRTYFGEMAAPDPVVHDLMMYHVQAGQALLAQHPTHQPDLIGMHGQTLYHLPEKNITVQVGDPAVLTRAFQVPVVHQFRRNDVQHGGQGAPLVPIYHQALVRHGVNQNRDMGIRDTGIFDAGVALVNIGGVSNFTYIFQDTLRAADCGPGNALLDDWVLQKTGVAFDADGKIARSGIADMARVRHWLQQDYFKSELSPKSLDRDKYQYVKDDIPDLNLKDGAATLAAFTAEAIALMLRKITTPLHAVIVCGGGAYNKAILANLANALPHVKVQTATSVGWQSDAIEAQAFGYLAVRTIHNLPITFPTTTGVQQPLCGGEIVFP